MNKYQTYKLHKLPTGFKFDMKRIKEILDADYDGDYAFMPMVWTDLTPLTLIEGCILSSYKRNKDSAKIEFSKSLSNKFK